MVIPVPPPPVPAQPGQVGIFTIGGKSFIKKLQKDGLYPVQDKYDPIPLPDVLQYAGRVIGLIAVKGILKGMAEVKKKNQ